MVEEVYGEVYASMRIAFYAVFKEQHQSATSDHARRPHFHVTLKADKQHKWKPLAQALRARGIYCHFSCREGGGYASAFRYGYCPTKKKPISELDPQPYAGRPLLDPDAEEHAHAVGISALGDEREEKTKFEESENQHRWR